MYIDNIRIKHGGKILQPQFDRRVFVVMNPKHYGTIPFNSTEGKAILRKTKLSDLCK